MTADRARPLRDFFAGVTEYAFEARLGVVDPPLVDYLVELLVRFVRSDSLFAVRDLAGRRLNQVADMMAEAEARIGDARREAHRHIGDFTLFWSGVYPEVVPHLRSVGRKDHLVDFRDQGKRAYFIASTIPAAEHDAAGQVLGRLSAQFEMCAYGLGEVRREWERRDLGGAHNLLLME